LPAARAKLLRCTIRLKAVWRELAIVSEAGVEIDAEAVPILAETRAVAEALGLDPLGMLASGSLLIATRPKGVQRIVHDVEAAGIAVSVVGRLTHDPQEASLVSDGNRQPLPEFAVDEVARLLAQAEEGGPSSPAPHS